MIIRFWFYGFVRGVVFDYDYYGDMLLFFGRDDGIGVIVVEFSIDFGYIVLFGVVGYCYVGEGLDLIRRDDFVFYYV